MATKAPLASLYAEGEEEQGLVDEIKGSYAKLREALDARQNQLFDPVLLAMAQGFLAPTKTGSFGESLGNVAAMVGPAQEAQNKREQEIASMRMEIAQRELAQRQAARGDAMFRSMLGGAQPSGLPAAGAPAEAPAEGQPPSARPAGMRLINSQDIARLAAMPGMEGKAKILSDMVSMNRNRFDVAMNGIVFDKDTGQYLNLAIPGQKQEPFTTPYGRFDMTPYEYDQFKRAESEGRGKEWLDEFRGVKKPAPGAPAAPGRPTVEQQAAQAEGAKTTAVKQAESRQARTDAAISAGTDVTGRLAQYSTLRAIASRPDANQIFGILNRPDVASAVLNLIQEGVRGNNQTIQAGAIEDSLRNVGLPQEQIDRYRVALSTMATIQLQQAKLAAGQGSVSNFERDLFASASISSKDTPGTILAKVSMLEERAKFDRQVAAALRNSNMSADEFVESDRYQSLVDNYLQKVANIASNIGNRPAKRTTQGGQRGAAGAAGQQLRQELGIR